MGAVLRRVVLGLLANEGMSSRDILLLCHGLVSESLPLLTNRERSQKKDEKQPFFFFFFCLSLPCSTVSFAFAICREKASAQPPPDPRLPPPSCLLLPPTPKRGGRKAAVSSRTSMHILVDAGLKVAQLPPRLNDEKFGSFFAFPSTVCLFHSCST